MAWIYVGLVFGVTADGLYKVINLNDNKTTCVHVGIQQEASSARISYEIALQRESAFTPYGDINVRYYWNTVASFHGLLLHYVLFSPPLVR